MFPLKVAAQITKVPFVTVVLILACTVIHWKRQELFPVPGLVPLEIVHSLLHYDAELPAKLLTLFTAFFIHGSLLHLAGNLWYLWVFGTALEQRVERGAYLLFYVLSGVVSLLVQVATDPLSSIPIVGASGAIAGVMGMYMVLAPGAKILFWFPPIFFIRLPALLFLGAWFWLQWLSAHPAGVDHSGVAWWAHIGGFLCGSAAGIVHRIGSRRTAGKRKRRGKRIQ